MVRVGFGSQRQRKAFFALLVVVFLALLVAVPAASFFLGWHRPSLEELFVAGRGQSLSIVTRGEAGVGGVAFHFDVDSSRMARVVPRADALFSAYSSLAESWAEEGEGEVEEEDEGPLQSEIPVTPDEEIDDSANPDADGGADATAGGEAETGDETRSDETRVDDEFPLVGDLDEPLRHVVETAWSDGAVKWELAVDLPVRLWEVPLLWHSEGEDETADRLKALVLRRMKEDESRALAEDVLSYVVFDTEDPSADGVHKGFLQLDLEALDTLTDALCPEEPARIDVCRIAGLPRAALRERAASLLDLLGESFRVQLGFLWKREGRRLLMSNTEAGLARIEAGRDGTKTHDELAPQKGRPVAGGRKVVRWDEASVLPIDESVLEGGGFLALVRQSHLQNGLLAALASLDGGDDRGEMAAFFSSPYGAAMRGHVEDSFSQLTRWSSEVFVQGERYEDSYLARFWYENPDAVRRAPDADALVKDVASTHAEQWLTPWFGARRQAEVSWASDTRVIVDVTLDGVAGTWSRPGLYSQDKADGPL